MNISNPNHNRKALVIFSGGQDSTTCLIQAIAEYGVENVETVTFQYGQRHAIELEKARWIAQDLGVKQTLIDTSVIKSITHNALMDANANIEQKNGELPNTFVDGRNALFLYSYCMQQFTQKAKVLMTLSRAYVKLISAAIPIVAMCLLNP